MKPGAAAGTRANHTHPVDLVPHQTLHHPFRAVRVNLLQPAQQLVERFPRRHVIDCRLVPRSSEYGWELTQDDSLSSAVVARRQRSKALLASGVLPGQPRSTDACAVMRDSLHVTRLTHIDSLYRCPSTSTAFVRKSTPIVAVVSSSDKKSSSVKRRSSEDLPGWISITPRRLTKRKEAGVGDTHQHSSCL